MEDKHLPSMHTGKRRKRKERRGKYVQGVNIIIGSSRVYIMEETIIYKYVGRIVTPLCSNIHHEQSRVEYSACYIIQIPGINFGSYEL